jgi:hypothetical protein
MLLRALGGLAATFGWGGGLPGWCGAGAGSAAGDAAAPSSEPFTGSSGLVEDAFGGALAGFLVATALAYPALAKADTEPLDDDCG